MRPYAQANLEWVRAPARFVLLAVFGYPVMQIFRSMMQADESVNAVSLQVVTRGIPYFLAAVWMFLACDLFSLKLCLYKKSADFENNRGV